MEYIAHFNENFQIHTVKEHLNSTAIACRTFGKEVGLSSIAELAGILHDIGKYSDGFQKYIYEEMDKQKNPGQYNKKNSTSKVDHGKYGAMYVYKHYHHLGGIKQRLSEILMMIICYHHGGLNDFIQEKDGEVVNTILKRFGDGEDEKTYEQVVSRFQTEFGVTNLDYLFLSAAEELEIKERCFQHDFPKNQVRFLHHLLIKHVYSMLIDADRTNTCNFICGSEETEYDVLMLWKTFIKKLNLHMNKLKKKDTHSQLEEQIKGLRQEISDQCYSYSKKENGIYTLTVPTGGGKTLSSLRFALKHSAYWKKKRIIYVLPFTTIIEQNAQEVRKILECKDYLLEHHSNVIFDEEEEEEEVTSTRKLLTERWNAPIIFTTMVQFLDTLYKGKTQSIRRMHHLSNSIIIFDEIQAIPIKCISLFNSAVNYLNKTCNTTIILCSATQPALEKISHPITVSSEMIPDLSEKFNEFRRVKVMDERKDGGYTYEELGELIHNIKLNQKSVLTIVNTRASAEKLYREMILYQEPETKIYYLSTNLCPAHRTKVIKEIKIRLEQKKDIICISTQMIEAGVDISFESVIRSVAGLDSIAQAAGRGNRHGERDIGEVYIINIKDENINNLIEIKAGAKHTVEVLHDFMKDKQRFENDLLSPKAIHHYYDYYYHDEKIMRQMDYPVTNDESVFDMLQQSDKRKIMYKDCTGKDYPFCFNMEFKKAGDVFSVIDQETTSVIVPYEEGKKLIAELVSNKSINDKIKLIKKAQQYSVNVSRTMLLDMLRDNIISVNKDLGIYFLNEGYYNDKIGIVKEGRSIFLNN